MCVQIPLPTQLQRTCHQGKEKSVAITSGLSFFQHLTCITLSVLLDVKMLYWNKILRTGSLSGWEMTGENKKNWSWEAVNGNEEGVIYEVRCYDWYKFLIKTCRMALELYTVRKHIYWVISFTWSGFPTRGECVQIIQHSLCNSHVGPYWFKVVTLITLMTVKLIIVIF